MRAALIALAAVQAVHLYFTLYADRRQREEVRRLSRAGREHVAYPGWPYGSLN